MKSDKLVFRLPAQKVCFRAPLGRTYSVGVVHEAIGEDFMHGQSYLVKTVLEQCDARNKAFLAFKDTPGNPLGCSRKP